MIELEQSQALSEFNIFLNLINSIPKGSLNGTIDNVKEKLDGVGKMNETLKKNSLDINILKFLPYRIDSLDNAIGNISET